MRSFVRSLGEDASQGTDPALQEMQRCLPPFECVKVTCNL